MDKEKVGKFIKKLREEKGMTQEELANDIFCSRSNLAHIENGRVFPSYDKIVYLAKVLGVSEMELYAGKRLQNSNEIASSFFLYIKHLKSKTKKWIILAIIVIIINIILFLGYYFLSSYNTIKMYKISGETNNFAIRTGTLLVSKDKIILAFSIDSKNDLKVDSITLNYIKNNNSNLVVSQTSPFVYIVDSYGYNEYFNYSDLRNNKGEFSLEIFAGEISDVLKLRLEQEYENKRFFTKKDLTISNDTIPIKEATITVPSKISESFVYKDGIYSYKFKDKDKNIEIYYYKSDGLFTVNEFKGKTIEVWSTFLGEKEFHYSLSEDKKLIYSRLIKIDSMTYDESKIYDYFKTNYLDKYVNNV